MVEAVDGRDDDVDDALDETFDEARELALVEGRGDAKAASK